MEIKLRMMTPKDLHQVREIARQHTDAIGFLPDKAIRHYVHLGSCIAAEATNTIVGFLIGHFSMVSAPYVSRIYQIAIDREWQHHGCGKMLVASFEREAKRLSSRITLIHVAEDLPAVKFWMKEAYEFGGYQEGGRRRDRRSLTFYKAHDRLVLTDPETPLPKHEPGGRHQRQSTIEEMLDRADPN